jgi:hypothetical protein
MPFFLYGKGNKPINALPAFPVEHIQIQLRQHPCGLAIPELRI